MHTQMKFGKSNVERKRFVFVDLKKRLQMTLSARPWALVEEPLGLSFFLFRFFQRGIEDVHRTVNPATFHFSASSRDGQTIIFNKIVMTETNICEIAMIKTNIAKFAMVKANIAKFAMANTNIAKFAMGK
jgi:hypothetical protein